MYFLLSLLPAFLLVLLLTIDYHPIQLEPIVFSLRFDTILIVIGNFLIAYYISLIINKKHKNNELKINNCFKELDSLLIFINELRSLINERGDTLEDVKTRYSSIISLQISLIKNYEFIDKLYLDKLDEQYYIFENHLTGENEINMDYKHSLLQLERTILNIKSNIL